MPAERDRLAETEDYPRMIVCDGRVSGSITLGRSRLPLWALTTSLREGGWAECEREYLPEDRETRQHYPTGEEVSAFLYHLVEQRSEFGRLLCVLADEDRRMDARDARNKGRHWLQMPRRRARVRAQLQRCIDEIDAASTDAQEGEA